MSPRNNRISWHRVAILALLSIVVVPDASYGMVGDTDGSFGLDGSIRTYINYIDYSRLPSFFTGDDDSDYSLQTLLRLTAGGRQNDLLTYEIHLVQSLILDDDFALGQVDHQQFPHVSAHDAVLSSMSMVRRL